VSLNDVVFRSYYAYPYFVKYPLSVEGSLLNRKDLTIGLAFGDRDFLGSEEAEEVVKTSGGYATGES
jgi:hypothetical protein